ncbi:hypothetical protein BN3087_600021 [Sulfurovum sp. enrichment culture clone C5]|uniref:Uncharacterized protein n=1 Tax=Sulfurovum sp. enrichment culture clone C5 TaxID=497650 RepID=A0A0S4XQA2_9BACT|nr:hypothetical protein BN3087_600021 [Sulfurovum sp. enrichment culture clone C5]
MHIILAITGLGKIYSIYSAIDKSIKTMAYLILPLMKKNNTIKRHTSMIKKCILK